MVASATTRSPSVMTIKSPMTTSRPAICILLPSRTTSACGLAKLRNASKTFSLRDSCTIVIAIDKQANTNRNKASTRSPSNKYTMPPPINSANMGWPTVSNNSRKKLRLFCEGSSL